MAATLLLKGNANPTTLIYMGGPSGGKTTSADMFADESTTPFDPLVWQVMGQLG